MWKLIEVRAFDEEGHKLLPLGPQPGGFVIFEAGRMLGAVADMRGSLPLDAAPRAFAAYTGTYRFDGMELVTQADDASKPELIVDQVRHIHFESESRLVAVPVSGIQGQRGTEFVWERVG
jgi:hypothetical protein